MDTGIAVTVRDIQGPGRPQGQVGREMERRPGPLDRPVVDAGCARVGGMAAAAEKEAQPGEPRKPAKASGTVLVVEDQEEVRQLTCMILRDLGFHVLEASDSMEALLVAGDYQEPIRLLVTDVIMPGINGRELAARLAPSRPEMLVIYMSGYTDRIMSKDGVLDGSVAYLQKPFTPEMLTQMVHRVLAARQV